MNPPGHGRGSKISFPSGLAGRCVEFVQQIPKFERQCVIEDANGFAK